MESRNPTDGAFGITRGADPVGDDDYLTKRYFDANNAAPESLNYVKMPLALITKVSTTAIPDNCIIRDVVIDVTTAYDSSATIKLEREGDATVVIAATTDSDAGTIDVYHIPQVQDWGSTGSGNLEATVAGGPTVGAATIYIGYTTPTDIT
jgi:hypothetical protein